MPKIAYHQLDDEGNKMLSQAKRNRMTTILGWSMIGNVFGIAAVNWIDINTSRFKTLRQFKKREFMRAGAFFLVLSMFTCNGYGKANIEFQIEKKKITNGHSISVDEV